MSTNHTGHQSHVVTYQPTEPKGPKFEHGSGLSFSYKNLTANMK